MGGARRRSIQQLALQEYSGRQADPDELSGEPIRADTGLPRKQRRLFALNAPIVACRREFKSPPVRVRRRRRSSAPVSCAPFLIDIDHLGWISRVVWRLLIIIISALTVSRWRRANRSCRCETLQLIVSAGGSLSGGLACGSASRRSAHESIT